MFDDTMKLPGGRKRLKIIIKKLPVYLVDYNIMTKKEQSFQEILISWIFEDLKDEQDLYEEYR